MSQCEVTQSVFGQLSGIQKTSGQILTEWLWMVCCSNCVTRGYKHIGAPVFLLYLCTLWGIFDDFCNFPELTIKLLTLQEAWQSENTFLFILSFVVVQQNECL